MVTYAELIQFVMMICTIITLVMTVMIFIFNTKEK